MSAHLHRILQDKEVKITELFQKLEEYDRCLDDAERAFKAKLQKKSQVIFTFSRKHFVFCTKLAGSAAKESGKTIFSKDGTSSFKNLNFQ